MVTRVGKVPGKVGATAVDGVGGPVVVDAELDVVLLDGVSVGSPMSVVESCTLVVYDVELPVGVVALKWGTSGRWVPGGRTVSESVVLQRLDICTTAITRPATSASPTRPAARVAAEDWYHGCLSGAMAADTSRLGRTAPDRRLGQQ